MNVDGCTAAHRIRSLHDLPRCGNPPFPESAPATVIRLLQDIPRRGNPLFTESAPITAIRPSQKQKIEPFCNFFAIADSSPPPESE